MLRSQGGHQIVPCCARALQSTYLNSRGSIDERLLIDGNVSGVGSFDILDKNYDAADQHCHEVDR